MSLLFGASGCFGRAAEVKEEGYYQYIIVEENGIDSNQNSMEVIAIVGLTDLGKQQKIIDFPRVIDGKPVRYIGYRDRSTFMNSYYHLESDNLQKVYVHENIKRVYDEAFVYFSENKYDLEIMVCEPKSPYLIFADHYFGQFYIYKSLFDSSNFNDNINWANIVFMNNYSDEVNNGYYRLDNIETGETIPEPPAPEREGYEFTEWYTEPECNNAWDFDELPDMEENMEFRLYAGWRIM